MKVLFISYYFPPNSSATPVLRTMGILKYIPLYGIEPYVLTSTGYVFNYKDDSFVNLFPEQKVFRVKTGIIPPKNANRRLALLSRYFTWPDSAMFWIKKAIKQGISTVRSNKIDKIVAISPPFSALIVGYYISKKTGVEIVTDFMDPWEEDLYRLYNTPLQKWLTRYFEKKIVGYASALSVINPPMRMNFIKKYNKKNVFTVPFGYFEDRIEKTDIPRNSSILRFLYLGTIGGQYKNIEVFLRGINLFYAKHFNAPVEFYFVGKKDMHSEKLLKSYKDNSIISLPYIDFKNTLSIINKSDVLVLLSTKGKRYDLVSTSKVFEIFAYKRPVFAIVPEGWLKDFVERQPCIVAEPESPLEIAAKIESIFDLWKSEKLYTHVPKALPEYNYKNIARKMAQALGCALE